MNIQWTLELGSSAIVPIPMKSLDISLSCSPFIISRGQADQGLGRPVACEPASLVMTSANQNEIWKYQVSTDAWTCKEKKAKELGDFHTDNVKHWCMLLASEEESPEPKSGLAV